jgi:hypothetical protein
MFCLLFGGSEEEEVSEEEINLSALLLKIGGA